MNLKALNSEQRAAVAHKQGPILVVAGAGTGKTKVITERIGYLIERKLAKPQGILALTFTEKASQEMETRVSELLGRNIIDVNITTFNSYGNELLQRFSHDIGLGSNLLLMTGTQQLVFLQEHIDELELDYYTPITSPESMLAELIKYFSKLKNELIRPDQYTNFAKALSKAATDDATRLEAKRHSELANAFKQYLRLSRELGRIDLDDQLYLTIELLEKRPNLLKQLQQEVSYLLVDEFQDTNTAQSRLIQLIAGETKNVMAVGDDDQCIYKFRGAAISNILSFKELYPEATQLALIQNYRSSQEILNAAHQLIENNNPERLEAKYNISKRLVGQFNGNTPVLKTFTNQEEEAHWIATDIKRQLKAGVPPTEIAILLRKNSQANILTRYLEAESINYIVFGQSLDLYKQPEVKMLLNLLSFLIDPRDDDSLYHLLVSPIYDLDSAWLRTQASTARRQHLSLITLLEEIEEKPRNLNTFLDHLKKWRDDLAHLSVGRLSYAFLEDTGYLRRLISLASDDPSLDRVINNLNHFFKTLLEFERVASDSSALGYVKALPALLGAGEAIDHDELAELELDKIMIMTIHKSKGLEFEAVYLFDMTQGSFPAQARGDVLNIPDGLSSESRGSSHVEEERRLMYVAMTRAKRYLTLTYSADHGGKLLKKPSIFLEEALGPLPELKQPVRGVSVHTKQIDLFAKQSITKGELPANLKHGENLRLGVRQIEDYLKCPREFWFKHIINPPLPQFFALDYGNLIHAVIQWHNRAIQQRQSIDLEALLDYLKEHWPAEGFISLGHKERSLRQAVQTIANFYNREKQAARHPNLVEKAFTLEMPDLRLTVHGRFDAVYQLPGETEIRDYKTGATGVVSEEVANKRAAENFQLGIYALAWQHLFGEAPKVLSLDFVDQGFIGESHRSQNQLSNIERKIATAAEGIRSGNFEPSNSHYFCMHPEYGL